MKSKFYLAAALTMSLAACTNEDVLISQESQNGVSPIAFNLDTNDEIISRNVWGGEYKTTVYWDKDTHLSLFHGGQTGSFGTSNAIYKANAGSSEDGKLSFSTQSMVEEGQAIMVHPADTMFEMSNGSLYVKSVVNVTKEGDSILHRLPFISEGIDIAEYNKDSNHGAGYGKEYDVKLRQIGSLLRLRFNWLQYDKIAELLKAGTITHAITIDKVSLNRPTDKFNTKLSVLLEDKSTGIGTNWSDVDENGTWNMASVVDVENVAEEKETITSADATLDETEGTSIVKFMLLPQNYEQNATQTPGTINTYPVKRFNDAANDASIVVETYYGTLTLDENTEYDVFPAATKYIDNDPYYPKEEGNLRPAMGVAEGLNSIIAYTNLPKLNVNSTFYNEKVGASMGRDVIANLGELDMSTVHIQNEEHLKNVIYVHEAIQPNTDVRLIIDGNDKNEFVMARDIVDLINKLNADGSGVITLQPCLNYTGHNECRAIRLTGGGEVPSFNFVKTYYVNVILADGNVWSWTGGEKAIYKLKNFINEGGLKLVAGAEVKFNEINGIFINKGRINVNGEVKQSVDTENYGTITVKDGAEYYSNAEFINEATSLNSYGTITNNGVFGNINEGVINNYGLIVQNTAKSKTFITSNQTDNVKFNTPWAESNKYGTIKLFSKDDTNYSVSNTANEGFIMIETTSATVTAEEIGKEANYVKIAGACTLLDFTRDSEVNTRVLYIEIASDEEVVWNTEYSTVRGLVVPAGKKLYIKKDNEVKISTQGAVYLKGKIYKGGAFTPNSFVSYFGTDADSADSSNVIKWANQ